jgi:beta-glucanase (GH16 family)
MVALLLVAVVSAATVKSSKKGKKAIVKNSEDCAGVYPCLIFDEDFNDFDLDVWQHEITASGGGNWEFQIYTNNRSNSYTKGGTLYIKPTLTSDKYSEQFLTTGTVDLWGGTESSVCTSNYLWGCMRTGTPDNLINPIMSARIRTVQSFNFRYGRAQVLAKMPKGDWIWPAIWMMPEKEAYGGWPASGEIDMCESRGNLNLVDADGVHIGCNSAGATMHWGPFWPHNGYMKTHGDRLSNFADSFHLYEVQWDENGVKLFIDDDLVVDATPPAGGFFEWGQFGVDPASNPWQYSSNPKLAPFDQPFYFILNVAVGGTNGFFPDTGNNGANPKPWSNTSPTAFKDFYAAKNQWFPTWNGEDAAMQVQYIKVWKLQDD